MAQKNNPKHFTTTLLIFILILILNTVKPTKTDDDLIQKTCKTTNYTDLCILSLKSNPMSSTADLKGLAKIMLNVAITNTTDTFTYVSTLLQKSVDTTTVMKKALEVCATKYSYANDSLKSSVDDLAAQNFDYATIHVSATAEYASSCRVAFRLNRGLSYPKELKAREEGLKRICGVVLGILQQLFDSFGTLYS